MDQSTFQQAIFSLLSGEHSLSILRALRNGSWHLSARSLGRSASTSRPRRNSCSASLRYGLTRPLET